MSTACSSCRHQRKRCEADCLMAPHFPQARKREFEQVHSVFGVNNATKRLKDLNFAQQQEAVQSIEWEASVWNQDPVGGPFGEHRRVLNENRRLLNENMLLREQLRNEQLRNTNPWQLLMQQSTSPSPLMGRSPAPNGATDNIINADYPRLNGINTYNYSTLQGRYRESQGIIASYHASALDSVSQRRDSFQEFSAAIPPQQRRESNGGSGIIIASTSTYQEQEQEMRKSNRENGRFASYQDQEIRQSNGDNTILASTYQEQDRNNGR